VQGVRSRSARLAAAWLLGAVLAVLALSHLPAAAAWTGTSADTVSGSKIVAMPVAKRPQATVAQLGQAVDAVLPPTPLLTLLAGVATAVLLRQARRTQSGSRPCPARGPPVALC
jgi:hypothetical protein